MSRGSIAAGVIVAVTATAWLAGGLAARRALAARLPAPDFTASTAAVRDHVMGADQAARDDASAEALGRLAMAYHASQMSAHAQRVYRLAEQAAPRDWRWTYYRGLLHEERSEHEEALEAFERVTALNPRQGLAWFRLAEIRSKRGDADGARQAYTKAGEAPVAPSFAVAGMRPRNVLPLSNYVASRLEGAGPLSTRAYVPPADPLLDAVVAQSRHTDLLLKHTALAARAGDSAWREFLARRAFEFDPTGLDVLLEMASMCQAAGKSAEAIEYLRKAEAIAPGDHHVLVQQGRTLADLDRLTEAEAVLRRAVRVRDAAAEYNLGHVLDRQGRPDEARDHYERALAIDPFHARAMNNLALQLDQRGQAAMAMALYARAIQAAPGNAETYSNMGVSQLHRGQVADAIASLQHAVSIDPGSSDALNNLGIALAQSGRMAEAIARFEEALRLNPRHAGARSNLDQLQRVRGQP